MYRLVLVCVLQCSMNSGPKCCAQGKGFQIARAASQNACEKFSKYFTRENSHMRFSGPLKRSGMKPFGCHPAIRTSGAAQGSSLTKQICINMVPIANFRRWFDNENEKSESIVESCLHLPSAFFEPQKMYG